MSERFLFSDEAGCFTFNKDPNVSRYFIICTVTTSNLDLALALTKLRHVLIREKLPVSDYFHATTDAQEIRDRVFKTLLDHDFKFQATICEKSKAQPQVRATKSRFYQYPWYYHLKHGIAPHLNYQDILLVTAASIGTKKERATYTNCLNDVMNQNIREASWAVDFRPAMADPLLQVADYCAWATQRKWERGDVKSFNIIKDRLTYEYDLWSKGKTHYY